MTTSTTPSTPSRVQHALSRLCAAHTASGFVAERLDVVKGQHAGRYVHSF